MTTILKKRIIICLTALAFLFSSKQVFAADPPVASNVSIDSGATTVNLTENTTTNVIVTATVTDITGCLDITLVTVKFYKTSTGSGAADDENNHYTVTTPTDVVQNSCVGDIATYTATLPVWYYADPAEWTAQVTPSDGTEGTSSTDTITINTLTALNVTAAISYGELALGADTGVSDQTTTITNTGNVSISTQVKGYGSVDSDGKAMNCTHGSILVGNEKYSKTGSTTYASKTALTSISATVADFSIPQRTSTVTTDNLFWGLGMSINGVGGSCTGVVVFTPI